MDDRAAVEARYRDYWRHEMLNRATPQPGEAAWEAGHRERVQFWEVHAQVTLESIELEGAYPDTNLVLVFHPVDRPDCRYAWRHRVWTSDTLDPEPGTGDPDDVWLPFVEWLDLRFRPAAAALPCSADPVAVS